MELARGLRTRLSVAEVPLEGRRGATDGQLDRPLGDVLARFLSWRLPYVGVGGSNDRSGSSLARLILSSGKSLEGFRVQGSKLDRGLSEMNPIAEKSLGGFRGL